MKTNNRGRVVLDEELESALLEETLAVVEPLADAGRLSVFLLQHTPARAPNKHALDELLPCRSLKPHPAASELHHCGWVDPKRVDETLAW